MQEKLTVEFSTTLKNGWQVNEKLEMPLDSTDAEIQASLKTTLDRFNKNCLDKKDL